MAETTPTPEEQQVLALVARVQEKLDALKISPRKFSLMVTGSPDFFRDIRRKLHLPSAANLEKMAQILTVSTDWLVGRTRHEFPWHSEVSLPDITIADLRREWRGPAAAPTPGIPLVGTGDCADLMVEDETGALVAIERSSFDPDYHVRYLARPPALMGATELYAIQFHGESMLDRFEPGELAVVDPRRPARAGDYVVVQLRGEDHDDVECVLVKKLVSRAGDQVTLKQLNPPLTFTLPKSRVKHIHTIVPTVDLLL